MHDFLELVGASGARYRYAAAVGHLSPAGGNFAIVQAHDDGSWDLLRLGETHSLATEAIIECGKAATEHGSAVRLFVRLNISNRTRNEELTDLQAAYSPLLNASEPA